MKKLRKEVLEQSIHTNGSITDLFDGAFIEVFNITMDEYDHLLDSCSDEELQQLVECFDGFETKSSFSSKRKALLIRNKYIEYFK